MEAKVITLRVKVKESCTEDLSLLADSLSNNILYDDTYDSLGMTRDESEKNIEEVSWEIEDGEQREADKTDS